MCYLTLSHLQHGSRALRFHGSAFLAGFRRRQPTWWWALVVESPPRIELFVRSLAPTDIRDRQERIVETLTALDGDGEIAGVEYTLCGECVCPSLQTAETDIAQLLLDRHAAFEDWAESRDRELVGFERRDTESLLTGTTVTGIVFPRITLAEYREGTLTFVAPSTDGTEHTTVEDRLGTY